MKKKESFLGKSGKIFGPFDLDEIEIFRATGEIKNYAYLWDAGATSWKPLEAPPSRPELPVAKPAAEIKPLPLDVLCHNAEYTLVSGKLGNVSEKGGDFIVNRHDDSPMFGLNSPLFLNILDPRSHKSLNLAVSMKSVVRQNNSWVYRVQWTLPTGDFKQLG